MTAMTFSDPRLAKLNGFHVELNAEKERADIVLDRPPLNVIEMPQRDQLRMVFEALDEDDRVRVIVLRAIGEHFSSGGNIKAVMADSGAAVGAGTVGGIAATGTSSSSATVMFTVLVNVPPG